MIKNETAFVTSTQEMCTREKSPPFEYTHQRKIPFKEYPIILYDEAF
jgi:hypothetical protein